MDMNNYLLKNMTWPEIGQKIKEGNDTVIINAASVEQHGPHLPECTDEVIGINLSCALAERLGNTLVAPTIIPGMSNHHIPLSGSLSLRSEVFRGIVEDYVSCYLKHGFKKFILFSSHGGNMNTMMNLVSDFKKQYPNANFYNALTLDKFVAILSEFEKELNLPLGSCGGHACTYETSLMLYLAPELVKMDNGKPGYVGLQTMELAQRLFKEGITAISEIGVIGDPTLATAEMGQKFYNDVLEYMAGYLKEQQ